MTVGELHKEIRIRIRALFEIEPSVLIAIVCAPIVVLHTASRPFNFSMCGSRVSHSCMRWAIERASSSIWYFNVRLFVNSWYSFRIAMSSLLYLANNFLSFSYRFNKSFHLFRGIILVLCSLLWNCAFQFQLRYFPNRTLTKFKKQNRKEENNKFWFWFRKREFQSITATKRAKERARERKTFICFSLNFQSSHIHGHFSKQVSSFV